MSQKNAGYHYYLLVFYENTVQYQSVSINHGRRKEKWLLTKTKRGGEDPKKMRI